MEVFNNYLIVHLDGELDHHSSEEVRNKIDSKYYDENLLNLVLDLRKVNFMDSSGIGLVMGRYKNCKEQGGNVSIVNTKNNIDKILEMSGLTKIIRIYPSIEEALEN
jgi:stage II sporulation protein AA (anti-sigma F factor antagonist)